MGSIGFLKGGFSRSIRCWCIRMENMSGFMKRWGNWTLICSVLCWGSWWIIRRMRRLLFI